MTTTVLRGLRGRLRRAIEAALETAPQPSSGPHFTVTLTPDEDDGGWVAECVELPGCVSEGETQHEALENIVDAITSVLAFRMEQQLPDDRGARDGGPRRVALTV